MLRVVTAKEVFTRAEAFDEFWTLYPRKVGKGAALKAWAKLSIDDHPQALAGLKSQLGYLKTLEWQYIPHASTWLNQWRWLDELPGQQQICAWRGCSKQAGQGKWCQYHETAIKRGETPV